MTFDEIYNAVKDGSLDKADVETVKSYFQATYTPQGQYATPEALSSLRETLRHLIETKQNAAGHAELRRDNSKIIRLTVAILIVAIITLLASIIFWMFPRS
jgi:hypothetical protein